MANIIASLRLYVRFYYGLAVAQLYLALGRILPIPQVKEEDLTGKVAIVTGANSGIGYSIASSLARANATVYLACRNVQKGQDAAAHILDELVDGSGSSKRVHIVQLDTSSLKSVRAFAEAWAEGGRDSDCEARTIDILVHNAGIAGSPPGQEVTADGLGTVYATNFIGSFLLTSLLEQYLSPTARVVFTSSTGQYAGNLFNMFTTPKYVPEPGVKPRSYSSIYSDTKSMQVAFARLLQRRWNIRAAEDKNRRVAHSFSPGFTATAIIGKLDELPAFDPLWWLLRAGQAFATPVDVGAATGFWLASTRDRSVSDPSNGGKYWDHLTELTPSAELVEAKYGPGYFARLWDLWVVDSGAKWD